MFFSLLMIENDDQSVLISMEIDLARTVVVQKGFDQPSELTDCKIGILPLAVIPDLVDPIFQSITK